MVTRLTLTFPTPPYGVRSSPPAPLHQPRQYGIETKQVIGTPREREEKWVNLLAIPCHRGTQFPSFQEPSLHVH